MFLWHIMSSQANYSLSKVPILFSALLLLGLSACSGPASAGVVAVPAVTQALAATQALPLYTPTPVPTQSEVALPAPDVSVAVPIPSPAAASDRVFDAFVERVINGRADKIVGVYVQNVLALPVIQQPSDQNGNPINPGFVSERDEEATQFLYAYIFADGNIGLIAHNYLAGRYFFDLQIGDLVELVYGDGRVEEYVISELPSYQALSPRSTTSDFVDLVTGNVLTSTELFYRVYGGEKRVTFQTCIARDNDTEWGRLFPIAFPTE